MTTVVDVRIIDDPWTGDLLAIIAILISAATLIWTLWMRRNDQARAAISQSIDLPVSTPGPAQRLMGVEVTNVGRSGTTVLRNIHLRVGREGGNLWILQSAYLPQPNYPVTLQPGESAKILVDPKGVAQACVDHRISPAALRVVASTGHGETSVPLAENLAWLVRDVSGGTLKP